MLTPPRAQRLTAAYREHAMKTVAMARHLAGLRAAAFLTAGIAPVPFWKFILADAGAALVSVPLAFGLAYFFTHQIGAILADVHRVERWLARRAHRAGRRPGRLRGAMESSRPEGALTLQLEPGRPDLTRGGRPGSR